jgi:hypothetical protein
MVGRDRRARRSFEKPPGIDPWRLWFVRQMENSEVLIFARANMSFEFRILEELKLSSFPD